MRLDPIIDHRKRRTEELEIELAGLHRERAAHDDRIAALRQELIALQRAGGTTGKLDLTALERGHGYARVIEARIVNEQSALAELLPRIEAKRQEVVLAHQDQKSLEKLRDREADRVAAAVKAGEIRTAEEIATVGFNIRGVGQGRVGHGDPTYKVGKREVAR